MDPLASRSMIVEAAISFCTLHKPRGSLKSLSADEPLDVRHFISLLFHIVVVLLVYLLRKWQGFKSLFLMGAE